jgi:2-keto-3-deoxy-L-arabinonate dehydratase
VLPIAPTPFTESGDVDYDGQRRVLDCMIDQGVDAICLLANFSEQFLLTDDERDRLAELGLTHVAGRVPVIVTCSHFSTRIAAERGRRAASLGASMLMLMPPYHGVSLRADENGIFAHFAAVAEAARIPIMVQDAPLSGVQLSVPFLVQLAKSTPLVNSYKIEVPGAAAKLRALIAAGSDAIAHKRPTMALSGRTGNPVMPASVPRSRDRRLECETDRSSANVRRQSVRSTRARRTFAGRPSWPVGQP